MSWGDCVASKPFFVFVDTGMLRSSLQATLTIRSCLPAMEAPSIEYVENPQDESGSKADQHFAQWNVSVNLYGKINKPVVFEDNAAKCVDQEQQERNRKGRDKEGAGHVTFL